MVQATAVVAQLHVSAVSAHILGATHTVMRHILQLLLIVAGQMLRVLDRLYFLDGWELQVTVRLNLQNLQRVISRHHLRACCYRYGTLR